MSKLREVTAQTKFKCPFCGAEAFAGMQPKPFTAHAVPECRQFSTMDPLKYLKTVNDMNSPPKTVN